VKRISCGTIFISNLEVSLQIYYQWRT